VGSEPGRLTGLAQKVPVDYDWPEVVPRGQAARLVFFPRPRSLRGLSKHASENPHSSAQSPLMLAARITCHHLPNLSGLVGAQRLRSEMLVRRNFESEIAAPLAHTVGR
jgi:hypothetical protein